MKIKMTLDLPLALLTAEAIMSPGYVQMHWRGVLPAREGMMLSTLFLT